jgi:DNA helicase-2/ATP-dependent DNA helicase PcrA
VRGALEQQAAFVVEQPDGELTREELSLVASWDADIAAVLEQARAATAQTRVVRLPATLSASQLISLQSDRRRFLETLVRPMPAQPSAAADRGTAFHAWLETFYGQRGMFEPDSLPGSGDDSIYSDELLERLKESFTRGAFAERTPAHMEMPFALVIAGRTVRGRIDAIFAGDESSDSARRWLVVDWKTGAVGSADPLQLHIYRHAWAHITGCSPDDVEAAFHYVSENETVFVPTTMTLEEIAVALTEAQ